MSTNTGYKHISAVRKSKMDPEPWAYIVQGPGIHSKVFHYPHELDEARAYLAGQLAGQTVTERQRFRPSVISGFEGVGGGTIQPEANSSRVARQKKRRTTTFWTYEMVLTDRVTGGPSRLVVGFSYNPKTRATDYAQVGFDVRLRGVQEYVGEEAAREAETKLINTYSKDPAYQRIAQETFLIQDTNRPLTSEEEAELEAIKQELEVGLQEEALSV